MLEKVMTDDIMLNIKFVTGHWDYEFVRHICEGILLCKEDHRS